MDYNYINIYYTNEVLVGKHIDLVLCRLPKEQDQGGCFPGHADEIS